MKQQRLAWDNPLRALNRVRSHQNREAERARDYGYVLEAQ